MEKRCENCLFYEKCNEKEVCDYYAEIEDEDREIDEYIEDERESFTQEWFLYIDQEND